MSKHQFIQGVAILLLTVHLAGCSTLFGRHQDEQLVYFDANVPEVEVVCEGKRAITPGSIALRQSKSHACLAEKVGYRKEVVEIKSGTSWGGFANSFALNTAAWGWWTLGIGTGIGLLVDFPSGAMRNLKQEHVEFHMNAIDESKNVKEESAKLLTSGSK